jgi:hypothetical protein
VRARFCHPFCKDERKTHRKGKEKEQKGKGKEKKGNEEECIMSTSEVVLYKVAYM